MSSVRGQGTGRRRRTAEVIGAHLEATTRFKGTDLKELSPDLDSEAELVVTTRQRIDLDIETTTHPGRLPPGTPAQPDTTTLDAELQQRLASAESLVATRIQQWAAEAPGGHYRRLLPGAHLELDLLGGSIGAEWSCAACARQGRRVCTGCTASGVQSCPDCEGRRHGPCRECRGLGRLACAACEGRGVVRPAPSTDTGVAPGTSAPSVPCAACSHGWLGCVACAGQGEQGCGRCNASGRITCPDCQGTRTRDCSDCAATGWQHRLGRLRERMEVQDLLEVHHPDPTVAAAITARTADVTTLDTTCALEQVRYTTAPLAVQAVQRLKLPVRQAHLLVAGQPMQFTALGPALAVVDFQQVAAVLMTHDLVTLEKNTAGSGRHLGEALQRFLQSPLNREIAWRTPAADIERQHPGMVDVAYQTRALQAVQRAVERRWRQQVWRPTLACLGGVGVVAGLGVALGSGWLGVAWTVLMAAGQAVGLGVMAWMAVEWRVRHDLAHSLGIPEGDRLLRPLRQANGVRRWQGQSLAAAAVVALAGAGAMTRLPHVRAHAEQVQATAALGQQLDAWRVSEGKDYRLRRYPDAEALAQASERAPEDPRWRLVRAWQLLLGVDGQALDPRTAERLLEGLANDPRFGTEAVIGQARAALLLRGRSTAALQAAAATLEALPEPVPPEALYTLALIQLAPAMSPPRAGGSASPGLATLQQAADLGHASACFELGRRLASGAGNGSGAGVKRDVAAARRYLGYAEAKGVPGATLALASLR